MQVRITEYVVKNNKGLTSGNELSLREEGVEMCCKHRQSNWIVTSELW